MKILEKLSADKEMLLWEGKADTGKINNLQTVSKLIYKKYCK